MATIALDATYTVDPQPSGVAIYSRRLIESLVELETPHRFLVCYRLSRFGRRREFLRPVRSPRSGRPNFSVRLFQEHLTYWLPWEAELFHSLAQRPPAFRFCREVVTIIDVFPLTGQTYSTPDFQRKFSRLLLEAAQRAALIITPSQYTADQLLKYASAAKKKIRVVPFGVDLPQCVMAGEQVLLEREKLVGGGNEMVLSVGVIQTRKNTLNALRALQLLPERYRLVLAGGDGHGSEAVHEFIRREGLGSRVVLLGYAPAETIPVLYQAASVFLFPSLEEGFGLPVLEAMAYGLPVVASRTSSLPEVGGDAALYVDPQDPHDIAQKVVSAVEDSARREEMIRRGLARAAEFNWRRTAEGNLKVYDEALSM
ncbi:MAG TPA: glycosyltransferase family 1 protein [Terriglobia bacterium]|nr:glycosyltransferase family 1 protein [Terriglobia bacterium]